MNNDNISIELACQRLIVEFAAAVDAQEYDRLRDLFTETARFARPTDPDTVIEGIDNIVAAFASRPRNRITQHLCTNMIVTPETAERARGRCAMLLFTADTSEAPVPSKGRKAGGQLVGFYEDIYIRIAAGWRIAERRGQVTLHV